MKAKDLPAQGRRCFTQEARIGRHKLVYHQQMQVTTVTTHYRWTILVQPYHSKSETVNKDPTRKEHRKILKKDPSLRKVSPFF
jgi:hypothetical protein